jgi:tetratricopeptide (TPR) repeat protein
LNAGKNLMEEERRKLESAVEALKVGQKKTAQKLFVEILNDNPEQDDAWVGLSLSTSHPERRIQYLRRALQINPGHTFARASLARLEKQAEYQQPAIASVPPTPKDPVTQRRWLEVYIGVGLAILIFFGALVGLALLYDQQAQAARIASLPIELTGNRYVFIEFYADW